MGMRMDIFLVFLTTQYFYGKYEDWVFKGLEEFEHVYGKDIAHQKKREQDVREYDSYACVCWYLASAQSW